MLALNSLANYDIITDTYKILYPNHTPVLFFDEIQNLNNWHFYLKRLHVKGYKIYVAGSNAHLISREIATYLKGQEFGNHHLPFFVPRVSEFEKCNVATQGYHRESTQNTEPFR